MNSQGCGFGALKSSISQRYVNHTDILNPAMSGCRRLYNRGYAPKTGGIILTNDF